ncbi:MAG: nickel pincer cofactor biosynthesis protein LarC [Oribacterium sp.]|nr:nickel pincer cofactor biosynthesis protein LarC [Oribacterium sp.]
MKIVYIECKMGVAGDMLTSALMGIVDNRDEVLKELNSIGIPKVTYRLEPSQKCGITGLHMSVDIDGQEEESIDVHGEDSGHEHNHDHEHHHHHHEDEHDMHHSHHSHRTMYDIEEIIENLNISREVRSDVREVYELLAEAESEVHGEAVSEIHFHEVGSLDAIADITAVCYLMHKIDPDKVIFSPINVGSGQVKCAHGILPVPTPATALLLTGVPSYSADVAVGELCTPTGAALAKYFAFEFGKQPLMVVKKLGYGMGKKDFDQANCVRVLLGEVDEEGDDTLIELICNIDDMTAEEMGYVTELLLERGAVDVFTIAADMKKNRPGTLLVCLCHDEKKDELIKTIFNNTTTIGIRENVTNRYILTRDVVKIDTPYGEVRVKRSFGYGTKRAKVEYEDLAGIARRTGKSILDLRKEIEDSFEDLNM